MVREFDLEKRTTDYAKAVIKLCNGLPKSPINNRLVGQLVGASGSIGANYREANDAVGKIARREAKESQHWLELLSEANINKKAEINILNKESEELVKILSTIIKKLEQNNR
jgi:four helix bundle protein